MERGAQGRDALTDRLVIENIQLFRLELEDVYQSRCKKIWHGDFIDLRSGPHLDTPSFNRMAQGPLMVPSNGLPEATAQSLAGPAEHGLERKLVQETGG